MTTPLASQQPIASQPPHVSTTRRAFVAAAGVAAAALVSGVASRPARAGIFDEFFGKDSAASDGPAESAASARPLFLGDAAPEEENQTPSCAPVPWAEDLSNVINTDDAYLTDAQRATLASLGFVQRLGSGGYEFFERYEMNRYNLMPNFVTVDSLVHTYHLYFAYLLKNLERTQLSAQLASLGAAMLAACQSQLDALRGTEWEQAAQVNVGFFAVGVTLQGGTPTVPEELAGVVADEVWLTGQAQGIAASPLFGDNEDYSQYLPRGYYAGEAVLDAYFRAMMWYGRRNFAQGSEALDRAALLQTLALAETPEALALWEGLYRATSFFAGASDDSGYYEYEPLLHAAFGEAPSLAGNIDAWQEFHAATGSLQPPQINSVPGIDEGEEADHLDQNKGFRFMGQRFSVDAAIFQQLIYNKVREREDGSQRLLPDVLDVPAALGCDAAYGLLEQQGDTTYPNYPEQMEKLREAYAAAPASLWRASLSAQWLDMLRPLFAVRGEGWPLFAQGDAWARRCLQTFAGSYVELKHDTVLYAKQVMAEAGGGPLEERDDRGYVEPEPAVFGRLASLVEATSAGLARLGLLGDEDAANLQILHDLSAQLRAIANKELRDELPTDEELDLIRGIGAQLEHFWQTVHAQDAGGEPFTTVDFPAAVVTDVATDPNGSVLEIATGSLHDLLVIVPVGGSLRIASGATFSFYQFPWPLSDRLTDDVWRKMVGVQYDYDAPYDHDAIEAQRSDIAWWTEDFTLGWNA